MKRYPSLNLFWVAAAFAFALRPIESFDTFWQLQSGKYIWQTGQFLYQDTFSLASEVFRLGIWGRCYFFIY